MGKVLFWAIFCITIFLAGIGVALSTDYWNKQEYVVTNIVVFQDNTKTLYEVTTDSGEKLILENEDLVFIGKTNSSVYGAKLKGLEGDCYVKITTLGIRIPALSTYQNICKIEILDEGTHRGGQNNNQGA